MRRSATVFTPLLASAAVALSTGCHHAEPQRCVDETNHVVDPKFCANLPPGAQQPIVGNPNNGGGSSAPVPGHSYGNVRGGSVSTSGTSRGGFGSSFSSSGGHGGGGGE